METTKIAIIGAGPAGIATSIQLKRFGYEPLLFEKDIIGGLLWNANLVENYPGFPKGISGPRLINLMALQLKQMKIAVRHLEINQLSVEDEKFQLTSDKEIFFSDYVVIASGTKPKPVQIKFTESVRKNIYQDIKKILDINGKHIVIIGAGDAAFDQAINLSKKNRVSIINHGANIKALQLLIDRALANDRISYLCNTEVKGIDFVNANSQKNGHILQVRGNSLQKENFSIECDEVVFALGRDPQLDFMDRVIENNRCILVGDVKNGFFRQATIAIGDGIKAAMKINNQILLRD